LKKKILCSASNDDVSLEETVDRSGDHSYIVGNPGWTPVYNKITHNVFVTKKRFPSFVDNEVDTNDVTDMNY